MLSGKYILSAISCSWMTELTSVECRLGTEKGFPLFFSFFAPYICIYFCYSNRHSMGKLAIITAISVEKKKVKELEKKSVKTLGRIPKMFSDLALKAMA